MIKAGDKVKYMGMRDPQYTNKVLEVDRVIEEGLILKFPLEDQREIVLDGFDRWKYGTLFCRLDEVEDSE
ncbi:hypothetical protein ACT6P2_04335 [Enterococcus lactis]|uniref:hypothetical protein n=1 Tax=Enterococcus lactis TaxID=357441 RepID=UPI0040411E0C